MTWVRWQLPSCLCEPCSHLAAAAWSRHVCPILLPQQCLEPGKQNWSLLSATHLLCSRDGCAGGEEPLVHVWNPLAWIPACTWSSAWCSPDEKSWTLCFRSATFSSSLATEARRVFTCCFSTANSFSLEEREGERRCLERAPLEHSSALCSLGWPLLLPADGGNHSAFPGNLHPPPWKHRELRVFFWKSSYCAGVGEGEVAKLDIQAFLVSQWGIQIIFKICTKR